MDVTLRHKETGAVKRLKIGWSWTCLFFSGVLGIPLFLRGLYGPGFLMLGLWVADAVGDMLPGAAQTAVSALLFLTGLVGLPLYFAKNANAMAGKRLLANGWEFADPGDAAAGVARRTWGVAASGSDETAADGTPAWVQRAIEAAARAAAAREAQRPAADAPPAVPASPVRKGFGQRQP